MKHALLFLAMAVMPVLGESPRPLEVGFNATIETIQFVDLSEARQKLVLERLGVQAGDRLSIDARQRIGRALGEAQTSVAERRLTFTYTTGSKIGTAKLIIRAGC